jgi:hypothetical protein
MSESAEVIKALKKTRALIVKGWTRGWYARNARRQKVDARSKTAVCWCLRGAIERAAGQQALAVERCLHGVLDEHGALAIFNDTQKTKEPVLALIDKAIAAEKEKMSHAAE